MSKVTHTYVDESTDKVVESDESDIQCDVLECKNGARMKGDELPEDWIIVPTKKGIRSIYVQDAGGIIRLDG